MERIPQERTVTEVFKTVPEGKLSVESQERDGCTMMKKWVLEDEEKYMGRETPGN